MSLAKTIKAALVVGWLVGGLAFAASRSLSNTPSPTSNIPSAATASSNPDDYVGSETCKTCHDDKFTSFSHTKHALVASAKGAKGEMRGCESCHGPGKAHVEGGGDKSKIVTFEGEDSKKISETCLECHAGKDEHNNYRRGEHWRNDIACVDCHSPHGEPPAPTREQANTTVSSASSNKPDEASILMLKDSEPQLCLKCHSEMRAQFTQPFHHKVLEGAMKCSDCHNPHGGFEQKQTRLATGADAMCVKCHTDKQGPFVFEHAPLKTEGCVACHTPHGSGNPKMLTRPKMSQLCIECHSNIGAVGAPNTPSFHNLATEEFQDCTRCHNKIHGSQTSEFFFR